MDDLIEQLKEINEVQLGLGRQMEDVIRTTGINKENTKENAEIVLTEEEFDILKDVKATKEVKK